MSVHLYKYVSFASFTIIIIICITFDNVTLHWVYTGNGIQNWAIPENIHTQPRTASMFYPPLAFGNSKMRYPPMPSEFHNREPPSPSEFLFF